MAEIICHETDCIYNQDEECLCFVITIADGYCKTFDSGYKPDLWKDS